MPYIAGIIISVYLLLLLISKKNKTVADKIFTVWFSIALIQLVYYYWFVTGTYVNVPAFLFWEIPIPLAHGPFLYLYILFLTNQQKRSNIRPFLHFIPFLLAYASLVPFMLLPAAEKVRMYREGSPDNRVFYFVLTLSIIISGVVYVILSLVLLRRHKKNIAGQFSNTEKITLNWIRYLIGGIGVIWIIVIFYLRPESIFIAAALFMFFIGYFGIRQVGIFSNNTAVAVQAVHLPAAPALPHLPEREETAKPETDARAKYGKSGLTQAGAEELHAALTGIMQEKELFKEPDLTLSELSAALDVLPSILSQVINSQEGKSFYDYVNALRVDAFKQRVAKPDSHQYTVLSLAFECGFNSKSTFNRNFRKITGLSPKEYLASLQERTSDPE